MFLFVWARLSGVGIAALTFSRTTTTTLLGISEPSTNRMKPQGVFGLDQASLQHQRFVAQLPKRERTTCGYPVKGCRSFVCGTVLIAAIHHVCVLAQKIPWCGKSLAVENRENLCVYSYIWHISMYYICTLSSVFSCEQVVSLLDMGLHQN